MKKLLISVLLILGFVPPALTAEPADEITYLEHQQGVNRIMCEKYIPCKMAKDMPSCTSRLNGLAAVNPNNQTVKVLKVKSDLCQKALKSVSCKEITPKSIEGPCSLNNLTK